MENHRARGQLFGGHRELASLPQTPRRLVGKPLLLGPRAQFHAPILPYTAIYGHICGGSCQPPEPLCKFASQKCGNSPCPHGSSLRGLRGSENRELEPVRNAQRRLQESILARLHMFHERPQNPLECENIVGQHDRALAQFGLEQLDNGNVHCLPPVEQNQIDRRSNR